MSMAYNYFLRHGRRGQISLIGDIVTELKEFYNIYKLPFFFGLNVIF